MSEEPRMDLIDAALDLFLGGCCVACATPGRTLCRPCRQLLLHADPQWHRPEPCPSGFPGTVVTGAYTDPWPGVLAGYKEHGVWTLAGVLARRLWPALQMLLTSAQARSGSGVVLVPIPSQRAAVRDRGLDTTCHLARLLSRQAAGEGWQIPVRHQLQHRRRVADSAGLGIAERAANLAGALRLPGRAAQRWRRTGEAAVLCDDLVTTGATLTEACRTLQANGIAVAGAITLVATPRRWR